MKKYLIELDMPDYFEAGQCSDCPLRTDWAFASIQDYDGHCLFWWNYSECKLRQGQTVAVSYDCKDVEVTE